MRRSWSVFDSVAYDWVMSKKRTRLSPEHGEKRVYMFQSVHAVRKTDDVELNKSYAVDQKSMRLEHDVLDSDARIDSDSTQI